ncbi:MAG: N-acetyl-gamma-glutamyl-phosphate reductase [Deltaproteobacteria bacterium]|nr:N-acetyl-gamma-glutamyl-phosphate reductase [Deltaproteobacteria bacterium]
MKNIAIIGATGYTGIELVRILLGHPEIKITQVTSEKNAGENFSKVFSAFQNLLDLKLENFNAQQCAQKAELAFVCLPHHSAQKAVKDLLEAGVKVIDLSADFRLHSQSVYEEWYGKHEHPQLLAEAAYGLPELFRNQIQGKRLIANPGCYPTSAALALAPLIKNQLVKLDSFIIDSKSGTSGAGRTASTDILFCEVNEGFKAYKVGSHRHTPEIEQTLSLLSGSNIQVTFTPHLLPLDRGILSTTYSQSSKKIDSEELHQLFQKFYEHEYFVRVKPLGTFPNVKELRGTNFCDIGVHVEKKNGRIIVISAIDNLSKGASGQAVQNMNILFGFEEALGLKILPYLP